MKIPKIYFGTAGWSYKDWVPNFYPKNQSKNFKWLEFYSQYFNLVEVNSSFYTYLKPEMVFDWTRQVNRNNDFLFTVKLHQDFTHAKKINKEKIKSVKENLDILKSEERMGGLLMQFPYSFHCTNSNVDFLKNLIDEFNEYEIFLEVRHKTWQNKKAKSITFCTIDQPQIGQSIDFNPIAGNDKAYIRFHGRNEKAWFESLNNFGKVQTYEEKSERYNYLYTPGELIEIGIRIKEIYEKVNKVFIVMNNHPFGNAPANAFELLHYLKEVSKVKMPETIVRAFPRLVEISK